MSHKRPQIEKMEPEVYIDSDADFASIKLAPGIEAKSYTKDGFVFCEDKQGHVIEIQILNLSSLAKRKSHNPQHLEE